MRPSSGDYHILPQNVKRKLHKISINFIPIKDLATKNDSRFHKKKLYLHEICVRFVHVSIYYV